MNKLGAGGGVGVVSGVVVPIWAGRVRRARRGGRAGDGPHVVGGTAACPEVNKFGKVWVTWDSHPFLLNTHRDIT